MVVRLPDLLMIPPVVKSLKRSVDALTRSIHPRYR